MKKLFIFDLDNTLSESRSKIDSEMAELVCELLALSEVAVMSGASFDQFKDQFISHIPCTDRFAHLSILPTSGAELRSFEKGGWHRVYTHPMSDSLRIKVRDAIVERAGISKDDQSRYIDDRVSQITYSALGTNAPIDEKKKYDPDQRKRRDFVSKIAADFPELSFRIGGTSSVDVTMKGIDKAFGIQELLRIKKYSLADAVYIGDALYEGGNDDAVVSTGIDVVKTPGPAETKKIIQNFLHEK